MLKALIKKQLLETLALFGTKRRSKKTNSRIGMVILYIFVYLMMFAIFGGLSVMICKPMADLGLDWLYFSVMTAISLILGVFGSVLSTYAALYLPKDNESLLSLPIPSGMILLARMMTVYLLGFFFQSLVMLPALVCYFIVVKPAFSAAICAVLVYLLVSLLILTLSCALGFVVAAIAARVKRKSLISVFFTIAFLAVYFYCYTTAVSGLSNMLTHLAESASSIRSSAAVLYHLGRASLGWNSSFFGTAAVILALLAVTYLVMSRSFLSIATFKTGEKKAVFREDAIRSASVPAALLRKEARRLLGSPTYLINCGLGVLLMPIMAIVLLFKRGDVSETLMPILSMLRAEAFLPLALGAIVCMATCMNNSTAPSVSMEGRQIWVLQTLPVAPREIFKAKRRLQLIMTLPFAWLLTVVCIFIFPMDQSCQVLLLLMVSAFCTFMASLGLTLNLKLPRLDWVTEQQPVKQGMAVAIALFGGWILGTAIAVSGWFLLKIIPCWAILAGFTLLLIAANTLLIRWMNAKGAEIFAYLS